jgi:hypothetical protein
MEGIVRPEFPVGFATHGIQPLIKGDQQSSLFWSHDSGRVLQHTSAQWA